MRMVDMLGNGYITTSCNVVAFLAFADLRACILTWLCGSLAVVLELMFKIPRFRRPRQNDAREDGSKATLEYIHGMPVVKVTGR